MGLLNYDPNKRLTAQQVYAFLPSGLHFAAAQTQLKPAPNRFWLTAIVTEQHSATLPQEH